MQRTPLTAGWSVRDKTSEFAELLGHAPEWRGVNVPHDASIGKPRDPAHGGASGYLPGGAYEYRRMLHAPEEWRDRVVVLEFEGVQRSAQTFVNGALAGRWAAGYTQFVVPLDPHLRYGVENEIRVECRTSADSRWYAGAGIHRPVHLLVGTLEHIAVDGVRVTTREIDETCALVDVAVTVENQSRGVAELSAELNVIDPDGDGAVSATFPITVQPGEQTTARQRLVLENPQLWGPASPALYRATVDLLRGETHLDAEVVSFGIRTVSADPLRGLRINGEQLKLRGACIHSDNGILGASAFARSDERRVELLRAAGFNALRSAHNPMSRAMLDACDRLGVLVMDELTDMWTAPKSDSDHALQFPEWWERDLEAMVRKDQNHPSVIMYSIGNEIPELAAAHGRVWSRRISERLRQLDDSRLVTNAVNGILTVSPVLPEGGINALLTNLGEHWGRVAASERVATGTEEAFAVLDVAGMNYMDTRYELDREHYPHRVIVGSETFPGHIDRLWRLVQDNPHVIGDFTWTGWDYLGEAGIGRVADADDPTAGQPGAPYPWLLAWCGDLDITGHRRPVSYYREIVFGLRTDPYIAVQRPERHGHNLTLTPWAWSDSVGSWSFSGAGGQPVVVEVYSDADEVELLLNGRSLGVHPAGEPHRYRTEFWTVFESGQLLAIARSAGREIGRSSLISAQEPVRLCAVADRTVVRGDGTDLTYVDISLRDDNGTVALGIDLELSVSIDGPAVLAGLGNASPATEESYVDSVHSTFDGRALAVVRPIAGGAITVTIASPRLADAVIHIEAR